MTVPLDGDTVDVAAESAGVPDECDRECDCE
jgi:hypothetical protein